MSNHLLSLLSKLHVTSSVSDVVNMKQNEYRSATKRYRASFTWFWNSTKTKQCYSVMWLYCLMVEIYFVTRKYPNCTKKLYKFCKKHLHWDKTNVK